MVQALKTARLVAQATLPVLVLGESGTGKGIIARAIHEHGGFPQGRKDSRPFIEINCPAIPETLFESELFGYQKGAFTGATRGLHGKVALAEGGTLFFDEIGELPLGVQAKLLKLIEEKVFEPLGSAARIRLNTRVICATNQDILKLVQEGRFRKDLYYRINGITILVPPLRERRDDIVPLAEFFVCRYAEELKKKVSRISPAVQDAFLSYQWPGNVREMRNVIERAVILCTDEEIRLADIPAELQGQSRSKDDNRNNRLEDLERNALIDSLQRHSWNISASARYLGITRNTLRYRIRKYRIVGGS